MTVKGKQKTETEKKEWRNKRNKLRKEMEKAKKVAMKTRAENNMKNSGNMMNSLVVKIIGERAGP